MRWSPLLTSPVRSIARSPWPCSWLEEHYGKVVRQPLAAALHTAPRIHVQPQLYTPPPLRRDAAGYFPEWGKAWIGWGIPRYGF